VIVPDNVTVTRNNNEGIVIATGAGTKDRPMEVRVNERVMYKKGDYPKVGDCEVVSLDDILFVLNK
jgi:co-chaperonin GroES (HSP10)